jgi:hypothetical protein
MASYVGDGYTYDLTVIKSRLSHAASEPVAAIPAAVALPKSKSKTKVEEDYMVYLEPEDIDNQDIKYIPPPNAAPAPVQVPGVVPKAQDLSKDKEIKRLKKVIKQQQETINMLIAKYVKPMQASMK